MRHFSLALRRPCCSQGAARRLRQPGAGHSGNRPPAAVVVNGSRAQAQAYVRHLMAGSACPQAVSPRT